MTAAVEMFVGSEWRTSPDTVTVADPYNGKASSIVHRPSDSDVDEAMTTASRGAAAIAAMPAHARATAITRVAAEIASDSERFAQYIVTDCGKTIRDARGEVGAAVEVLQISAEEATRISGEVIPLDAVPAGEGLRVGMALRFPVGVVVAIGPFNAPLQVLCHKVGPALAAGNSVVVVPARQGAICAAELIRLFHQAGIPEEALQLLPAAGETAGETLVGHPAASLIAFTGSGRTADKIIRSAGLKRTLLELSGNAGVIIHQDGDWETAVAAAVPAAYGIAGQSCVSLQRLYVHSSLYDAVVADFTKASAALRLGDTMSEDTDIGVMISEEAAARLESWVNEAVSAGATATTGGSRNGTSVEPTVLVDVEDSMRVVCDEVFGPVVSIMPYDEIDDAITRINDSPWGLAAGVYTASLAVAMRAAGTIRTGVVNINGQSRYRVQHMPYGGVKASGWGKEGPRYSIQDMTEVRMITVTAP